MRRSPLIWTLLGVVAVCGVFVVKERVQTLEEKLQTVQGEIATDKSAIRVLNAEWSYLNRPDRIETMNGRILGMVTPSPNQYMGIDEFLKKAVSPDTAPDRSIVKVAAPKPMARAKLRTGPLSLRKKKKPRRKTAPPADSHAWLNRILTDLERSR